MFFRHYKYRNHQSIAKTKVMMFVFRFEDKLNAQKTDSSIKQINDNFDLIF